MQIKLLASVMLLIPFAAPAQVDFLTQMVQMLEPASAHRDREARRVDHGADTEPDGAHQLVPRRCARQYLERRIHVVGRLAADVSG